jgi:asparagine synthase (glutamine-hydrolysing)
MCGIAGIWGPDAADCIEAMTQGLKHRGPDNQGILRIPERNLALGHRRLSILDLSSAGNQPIQSHCRRFSMVFNGEIYNFLDLKQGLQDRGHSPFHSRSDTEVLLEMFAAYGLDMLPQLNGMFALGIYDHAEEVLWLIRDRLGIKPLYYGQDARQNFRFGSDLSVFADAKPELNPESVAAFFHLGFVPGHNSIRKGIFSLPPGHVLKVQQGRASEPRVWWSPPMHSAGSISESAALQTLQTLLESSVDARLVSDVPFGTFLSGGVDSSLITAIAAKKYGPGLRTFSIAMPAASHNESVYAEAVARQLKTKHTTFTLQPDFALEWVPRLPEIFSEPFADSSALPTLAVSKLAREEVTMVLTGDGGDELFWGYGAYRWADRLSRSPWSNHAFQSGLAGLLGLGRARERRVARLLRPASKGIAQQAHIFSQEQYLFRAEEVARLTGRIPTDRLSGWRSPPVLDLRSAPARQAFFDLTGYLPDDLLVKVDRATMANSLEARVPLLDYRVVEFALGLPDALKWQNGHEKYLLKQLLYKYLPAELFQRPKWGFSVPLASWLQKEGKNLVDQWVLDTDAYRHGLLDRKESLRHLTAFRRGNTLAYNRVWLLLVFNQWMNYHE